MSSKVTVTLPENVTYAANGRVYRSGETFDVERDDLVDAFLRNGNLVEVKPAAKKK